MVQDDMEESFKHRHHTGPLVHSYQTELHHTGFGEKNIPNARQSAYRFLLVLFVDQDVCSRHRKKGKTTAITENVFWNRITENIQFNFLDLQITFYDNRYKISNTKDILTRKPRRYLKNNIKSAEKLIY